MSRKKRSSSRRGKPGKAMTKGRGARAPRRGGAPLVRLTAKGCDRHALYQRAVQEPDCELDFVEKVFRHAGLARPTFIREDFCGTALNSRTWVQRRAGNRAVGVDIEASLVGPRGRGTLDAQRELNDEQCSRLTLVCDDVRSERLVREAGTGERPEAVLALNFSYWIFSTRADLLAYFRAVRAALGPTGRFVLDFFGGSDCLREMQERRRIPSVKRDGGFTYVWDQQLYDPVSGRYRCTIGFEFPDGTALRDAFVYSWRLWTLPELRDLLAEAGFARVDVWTEGDDSRGNGDGVWRIRTRNPADRSFLAYVVASAQ